ncbi:MAG: hypothetical protein KKD56_07945, partial [Acidobacteria bacterium]|nr:hypothetical protein [Acidobacteriota bacterium]
MTEKKNFAERYYNEYNLKGRVKLSIILSMIFYPGFLFLDAIYTPDHFRNFLIIRLFVILLNAIMLILHRYADTVRKQLNLGMAMLIVDAAGIALMTHIMGGFMSSYYQGLTLVIMCMMVLLSLALREAAIVSAFVWA